MDFIFSPAFAADDVAGGATAGTVAVSSPPIDPNSYDVSAEKVMKENLFVLLLLFGVFYFVLIRPQQKRLRAHQAMIKSLQKGSKVITTGGIIGTVIKFEGDEIVVIEIAQGVRVRLAKSSVAELADDKVASSTSANDN